MERFPELLALPIFVPDAEGTRDVGVHDLAVKAIQGLNIGHAGRTQTQ
jgi:hypothetical protein